MMWSRLSQHLEKVTIPWVQRQSEAYPPRETAEHGEAEFLSWAKVFLHEIQDQTFVEGLNEIKLSASLLLNTLGVPPRVLEKPILFTHDPGDSEWVDVLSVLLGWKGVQTRAFSELTKDLELPDAQDRNTILHILGFCGLAWGFHVAFGRESASQPSPLKMFQDWVSFAVPPVVFLTGLFIVVIGLSINREMMGRAGLEARVSEIFRSFAKTDIFVQLQQFVHVLESFLKPQVSDADCEPNGSTISEKLV